MLLFLMKALWAMEAREFMNGAKRMANILAIIFAIAWIKLMGLKLEISSAPSFLGMRTMFAVLSQ